jgi:hypothetical protein
LVRLFGKHHLPVYNLSVTNNVSSIKRLLPLRSCCPDWCSHCC